MKSSRILTACCYLYWTYLIILALLLAWVAKNHTWDLIYSPRGLASAVWADIATTEPDLEKEQASIVEMASKSGIQIIDKSSKNKVHDIILMRGLRGALDVLPKQVWDSINGHPAGNFKVIIIDATDYSVLEREYKLGGYFWDKNEFYIREGRNSMNDYRYDFIHDIGHAYQAATENTHREDFFADIRNKEAPPTRYGETDVWEDFAETFAIYFLDNQKTGLSKKYLQGKTPLRYQLMEDHFKNGEPFIKPKIKEVTWATSFSLTTTFEVPPPS